MFNGKLCFSGQAQCCSTILNGRKYICNAVKFFREISWVNKQGNNRICLYWHLLGIALRTLLPNWCYISELKLM